MGAFLSDDFLLNTDVARRLYHEYAADCPIIDYHCHISPKEIWDDMHYENITQVWLGGDHYKWRLMRCAGIDEKYITGDATDHEKFIMWAKVIGRAVGNPLYHWSHLELKRFFGYEGVLNEKTAEYVWNLANEKLKSADFGVRGLINMSNVETICTTDDPVDSLEWHDKLARDTSFGTGVLPAWRPDKAMNIEKKGFVEYIERLSAITGFDISSFDDLKNALRKRMDFFSENKCCLSDHALNYIMFKPASDEEIERIFERGLAGYALSIEEQDKYRTAFMIFAAEEYKKRDWVMQLHYGCRRDNNLKMFDKIGSDTGFDTISDYTPVDETAKLLDALDRKGFLPKTILYSLNPNDNQKIDALCGCFQNSDAVCRIQHGSAWWFNDHFQGMTEQLTSFASLGYLAGFVGMLTDSRSFLSYPRHEYFRRILCRLLGEWVEDGRYPEDYDLLSEIVTDISYGNAKRYFRFAEK